MARARAIPKRRLKQKLVPAPMGGLNTVSSLAAMPTNDAVMLVNLFGGDMGLRSRLGYYEHTAGLTVADTGDGPEISSLLTRDWEALQAYDLGDLIINSVGNIIADPGPIFTYGYLCTKAGTSAASGGPTGTAGGVITDGTVEWSYIPIVPQRVRSIFGFNAATTGDSKLFATTKYGIYDVTGSGLVTGDPLVIFPAATATSGRGVATTVVAVVGGTPLHTLVYTDETYGYYLYRSGAWSRVGNLGDGVTYELDGMDAGTAGFCCVWKHRLWLVGRDSASAYYLDLDSIAGTATRFSFAGKFPNGGHLVGLWSWTFDGGSGPDDALVALSSSGDVCIYTGTDPSIPGAFNFKGSYFIGPPPSGRKVSTDMGGDLGLLGSTGLVPLSKLVLGSIQGDTSQFPTHKITPLISRLISSYGLYEGWAIKQHPTDNCLMIAVPTDTDDPGSDQVVMSNATKGWATYERLPIACMESFQSKLYFGTVDGRICVNDGYKDNVPLSDPAIYSEIQFRGITAFDKYGSLNQKRVQFLRCNFTSDGTPPNYTAGARYRFNTAAPSGGSVISALVGALWNTAVWDTDVWPSAQDFANEQRIVGATGIGAEVAIAFAGKAINRVVLIGFDVMYDEGGLL